MIRTTIFLLSITPFAYAEMTIDGQTGSGQADPNTDDVVRVTSDLYVEGDGDDTYASMEVAGDLLVTGAIFFRDGFFSFEQPYLGQAIYSTLLNNKLYMADSRYNVSVLNQQTFTNQDLSRLFDGVTNEFNYPNTVDANTSISLEIDIADTPANAWTYLAGPIVVNFLNNSEPDSVQAYWIDKNNTQLGTVDFEPLHYDQRTTTGPQHLDHIRWVGIVPYQNFGDRLIITITADTNDSASVGEIELYLNRPTNKTEFPVLTKYFDQKLYKKFSFVDSSTNSEVIIIDPEEDKITVGEVMLTKHVGDIGMGDFAQ